MEGFGVVVALPVKGKDAGEDDDDESAEDDVWRDKTGLSCMGISFWNA